MKTTLKKPVLFIILLLVLYALMVLFGPPDSLDRKLYYSGEEARALLESFSAADLKAYFINEWIDLGFLTTYTLAFVFAFRSVFPGKPWLLVFPLLGGCCDLIETSIVLAVLKQMVPHSVFNGLGGVTFVKWSAGAVAGLILIYGLIHRLLRPKRLVYKSS